MINAVPVFRLFEKKGIDHLPRVYISDPFALPKQRNSGETFVNMQRVIRSYGSMSGIVLIIAQNGILLGFHCLQKHLDGI